MPQQKCGQLTIFRFRQQRWKCVQLLLFFCRKSSRFVFIHKQKWTTQPYRDKHSQERVTSHWASTGLKTTPPSSDRSPSARLTDIKMIFISATRGGVRNITFSCYNIKNTYLSIYISTDGGGVIPSSCYNTTVHILLFQFSCWSKLLCMYVYWLCIHSKHSCRFWAYIHILNKWKYIFCFFSLVM